MKEETKAKWMAALLFLSTIGLFIMSFIDYHPGLKIFKFGNPIVDEDWIFTILSIIGFAVSFRYVDSVFKKLRFQKKTVKERIAERKKTEHFYLFLIFWYFVILLITFIDLKKGTLAIQALTFDSSFYRSEDIFIALFSLFGITKFSIDYIKLKRNMGRRVK